MARQLKRTALADYLARHDLTQAKFAVALGVGQTGVSEMLIRGNAYVVEFADGTIELHSIKKRPVNRDLIEQGA